MTMPETLCQRTMHKQPMMLESVGMRLWSSAGKGGKAIPNYETSPELASTRMNNEVKHDFMK